MVESHGSCVGEECFAVEIAEDCERAAVAVGSDVRDAEDEHPGRRPVRPIERDEVGAFPGVVVSSVVVNDPVTCQSRKLEDT